MTTSPFFSVVVPVVNRAEPIRATIDSVLTQTFKDWELIIVDDGSEDHIADVIQTITSLHEDKDIVFLQQKNEGGGSARNAGIGISKGKYIAFLDSDDVFEPMKLAVFFETIRGNSNSVFYSQTYVNRGVERFWVRPSRGIGEHEDAGEYMFCANHVIQTSTMVVCAEAAKRVLFDPDLRRGQDLDFCLRLHAAGYRFQMIEQPLSIWSDASEIGRTSYLSGAEHSDAFLRKSASLLTPAALHGYLATEHSYWICKDKPFRAAHYQLKGLLFGNVPFKTTLRQALRYFLPNNVYRSIVNIFVFIFGKTL